MLRQSSWSRFVNVSRILTVLVIGISPLATARGQQDDKTEEHRTSAWVGGHHSETSSRFPNESFNPDETVQARLRVEWDEPELGFRTIGIVRGDPPVTFTKSNESTSYCGVAISGTLLIESAVDKSSKPIDWFQGVRVLVAREPKDQPDWSKPVNQDNSVWDDCIIEKDGKFTAFFAADRIHRSVGRVKEFQVGLTLGAKAGRTVYWKDSTPVMPQSVTKFLIAGPKPLSPKMQILNASPSICSAETFNPVSLVKAVNYLQGLGKEKAIAELREFLKMARDGFMTKRDPKNIDTADRGAILLICQLLFEPAAINSGRPEVWIGMVAVPNKKDKALWPVFPLGLQDDLPFLVESPIIIARVPTQPEWLVDWADKHGKLRAKPLRPPDDPLSAADAYMDLPHVKRLGRPWGTGPRGQAGQAIADILKEHKEARIKTDLDSDAAWAQLKKMVGTLKIRWNENEQKYVAEK
jgi:hypothetical protein